MMRTIVRSLVVVGVVTGILIVVLEILRPGDNQDTIIHIVGFAGTIEMGLLAYLNTQKNSDKIDATHDLVNSRVSQLIESSNANARAEGVTQGGHAERARHSQEHDNAT